MKAFFSLPLIFLGLSASAQYYYKDLIGTKETSELIKTYRTNNVSQVVLSSYNSDNTRDADFSVEQVFSPANQTLRTSSRSTASPASVLISYVDANGQVLRTIDSSETVVSITEYAYNSSGQLVNVHTASADS